MLKKSFFCLCVTFLLSSLALAQTEEEQQKEKPKFGFHMGLSLGLSSYEDSSGEQIAFQKIGFFPEFTYGKWGFGLDLTFEFDGDFNLRDLDNDGKADTWSTFTDYLYKIYYIRYGYKGDPLYGRIGAFNSYTLGHGLIMDGFSNTLFYPQIRQLGLNLDVDGRLFDFPLIGMESLVDDVLDWDIIGVRLFVRPLMWVPTPIISKLKIGTTIVTDLDTQEVNDPTNPDYDDYSAPKDHPDSKDNRVTELGIDTEVPLLERESLSVIAYADWATIVEKGNGAMIGSTLTYRWLKVIGQLRFLGKEFVFSYFDPYYELERGTKYESLDAITDPYVGYLIGTDIGMFSLLRFFFYWSDGFNDETGPRIQSGVATMENALAKIDASFTYDKKDIDSFNDFVSGEDALLQLRVAYKVNKAAAIVFIYQKTFTPSGEATDKTLVETQFSF